MSAAGGVAAWELVWPDGMRRAFTQPADVDHWIGQHTGEEPLRVYELVRKDPRNPSIRRPSSLDEPEKWVPPPESISGPTDPREPGCICAPAIVSGFYPSTLCPIHGDP